ncbi:MAG: hypothetical protein TE42_02105 [Candidatus Synechococcus spongiarum SP3]|uniref:Uncharacterized protein n=1 Tax=Candidatus Synechococcus spongiarum SP3 TaxID=1604020 RepID=A0A0G2HN95_9SYNE|nr:MAG: hypothetical protein TE42_02105 [Candidatus Synechococcus spongiarum SP3]
MHCPPSHRYSANPPVSLQVCRPVPPSNPPAGGGSPPTRSVLARFAPPAPGRLAKPATRQRSQGRPFCPYQLARQSRQATSHPWRDGWRGGPAMGRGRGR